MSTKMYPDNIYIQHHDEIAVYGKDIGVSLDMYDNAHGMPHNSLARAQYKHWRATVTGVPDLLSTDDRRLLGLHDWASDTRKRMLGL